MSKLSVARGGDVWLRECSRVSVMGFQSLGCSHVLMLEVAKGYNVCVWGEGGVSLVLSCGEGPLV